MNKAQCYCRRKFFKKASARLPLVVQLLHGTAHLRHDVVGSALAADAQVPLGPPDTLVLGLLWVEFVQRVAGPRQCLGYQEGDTLWVGLDVGHSRPGGGQVLVVEEGVGGAGCQVEVLGLIHDAAIVNYKVVGHSQRVLVIAAVQAGQDLLLCAFELVAHFLEGLVVNHVVAVGGVLWEKVLGQVLFKPLVLSVVGSEREGSELTVSKRKKKDNVTGPQGLPDFFNGGSFHWVYLQHVLQKAYDGGVEILRGEKDPVADLFEERWHVVIVEGERPTQQGIEDDTAAPDIHLWASVQPKSERRIV